jgi:hypothetical protein
MSANLNFRIETQQGDLLCWAAVASSVSAFYAPVSFWTQCAVAGAVLKVNTCCQALAGCDRDSLLDAALATTGNLAQPPVGQLDFNAIKTEIDQGRPIGIRGSFSVNVGHFLILSGSDDSAAGQETVVLHDPAGTSATVLYSDFVQPDGYESAGLWTNSYLTRA